MLNRLIIGSACLLWLQSLAVANTPSPHWIWFSSNPADANVVHFRKTFDAAWAGDANHPPAAMLTVTCDNEMAVKINGKEIVASKVWKKADMVDVKSAIKRGKNVVTVTARRTDGHAALALNLDIQRGGDEVRRIISDASWRVAKEAVEGWERVDFDDSSWTKPHSFGAMGVAPWGDVFASVRPPGEPGPIPGLNVAAGFKVERVYSVPKNSQGSWVALGLDDKGRIIASDQSDKGLFRLTPSPIGEDERATKVEKINVSIGGSAQGILWAFDALYVNINGGRSAGVWRITDSTGDGELDKADHIMPLRGGGEHGPHALVPSADGEGIYVVSGNHTAPPDKITHSRIPAIWGEDLLLPRQWDARGHARGRLAPGGWIARISPDAKQREIISIGFRNQYDIALNHHGDIFTYDSDMEWDLGMPWFRPTRVYHAVSGSEFGWRSGTGKWPEHFPDSLPATVNVGPGSPTGVTFGYGGKFPTKWQDKLFILDWTYGTIWALTIEQDGATYRATDVKEFVSGAPLPVADAVVAPDGAFYFVVGGRNADSFVYRVVYAGGESTDPAPPAPLNELQEARRMLEALHQPADGAVDKAWPYLGHADRFLRYAARIAIENQPVDQWRGKALAERNPQALVTAMVALARHGEASGLEPVLTALHTLELTPNNIVHLEALRAYQLAFIRLGKPSNEWREKLLGKLDPMFPTGNDDFDHDLSEILVYLDSPTIVEKAMKEIANATPAPRPEWITADVLGRNTGFGGSFQRWLENPTPLQALHYAFVLRNIRFGWTLEQREQYFTFIKNVARQHGGNSYAGFLNNIRKEALENASEAERVALAKITGEKLEAPPPFEVVPPQGPGRVWTLNDALASVEGNLTSRDFDSGRNLYHAVSCAACHQFDGQGGAIGPDLSTVANKFSVRDLLHKMIDPNVAISDQYVGSIVKRTDGTELMGLVVEREYGIVVYTPDPAAPPVKIDRDQVESVQPSPISPMPPGLINSLNPNELADLMAYMLSRGDREAQYFK